MSSLRAAQSAYKPEKQTLRAPLTLATLIAQQNYFRQINQWSRSQNAMQLNVPESLPFARHNGASPSRAPIALLKTHFPKPGPAVIDQTAAMLLAHMDEEAERRKGYAGETIGKKIVEQITQTKDADNPEARHKNGR
jgi:hypothetical protein